MRRLFYRAVSLTTILLFIDQTFAAGSDTGILGSPWMTKEKLRTGSITFDDIPKMIGFATQFILWFAATIAMIMIIYGAFQMSLMALTAEDKKKWLETAKNGIIGFAISVSAWLIVKVVISNL